MKILIIFTALSLINVIFSTVRSITTIKCGKFIASLVSAGYFSFYNIVIVWTVADFPMWEKCLITFGCNLLGVFIVKLVEEKMKKDVLWIYNATAKMCTEELYTVIRLLKDAQIKLVYNTVIENELYTLQVFSNTQNESGMIKSILDNYNIKYYAIESKEINGN